MQKKIVIGSSMKFRELIKETLKKLEELGFVAIFPNIDSASEDLISMSEEEKARLSWDHYHAVEDCDAVYFILPKGYMGTNCKIELGYALALHKPVYFSERTDDIGLDIYPKEIISLSDLEKFKEIL